MPRLGTIRWIFVLPVLLAALMPLRLTAQDDPNRGLNDDPNDALNDAPLGDVARTLRRKTPPSQNVIDDDNLSNVMQRAESRHSPGSALKFLMAGDSKMFQVSAPDVTCSLAFTANVKSLLSSQYAQMELPPGEALKLEGPATIEGNALIVALYNRTEWHISEVAVALTVVKKSEDRDVSLSVGGTLLPVAAGNLSADKDVSTEKQSDVTVIYRMRAAAPPSTTTVFSVPLDLELARGEEWHWAIVQARGYPPQGYAGNPPPPQTSGLASVESSSAQNASAQGTATATPTPQSSAADRRPQDPQ